MRRMSLLLAVVALTGLSAGVVGGPNASDGEMAITSAGGSASASAAVGPNGTKWRTEISNLNSSCVSGNQTDSVEFSDFREAEDFENITEVEFSGMLTTSNPCQRIDLELTEVGNVSEEGYVVRFIEKSNSGACIQCTGFVRFEGSFAAPGDYQVTFKRDGEVLDTLETSDYGEASSTEREDKQQRKSVLEGFSSIFSWLGSLF